MAVSKNELPKYHSDWMEVQGFSTYGYVLRVLKRLNLDDDLDKKNRRKIQNVYAGILKDREILDAIREELLPKKMPARPMVERKKVMSR